MEYLAKSSGETIVDHTKELLKRLAILKKLYPNALKNDGWRLLEIACKYHDLGKMNRKFQSKLLEGKSKIEGEIPHALLSISMLPFDELEEEFDDEQIRALTYSIALHHARDFSEITESNYDNEIELVRKEEDKFPFYLLGLKRDSEFEKKAVGRFYERIIVQNEYFDLDARLSSSDPEYDYFVILKGFLNRIDYAASGGYDIESPGRINFADRIKKYHKDKNDDFEWNELQKWTVEHNDDSIVFVAQTGMGKTEAALRWAGNNKTFFVLPLRSAINAIFDRVRTQAFGSKDESNEYLSILYSDMSNKVIDNFREKNNVNITNYKEYVERSRQLSQQLTISTIDQIFSFVYHYQGFESKVATLSYSKVIVDEIQMYSPNLLAYIIYGLKIIQKYGGKFCIMTATLAPFIVDLMKEKGLKYKLPEKEKPFLDKKLNRRHKVRIFHYELDIDKVMEIYRKFDGNILIVCNTVNKAMQVYDALFEHIGNDVHMIHSRFIARDRKKKEIEIQKFSNDHLKGIWIGTQVIEASLDIDFDVLFTELSELNGLFQRMGRCYRRRNYVGDEYNVYVYDGGEKNPSGIHGGGRTVVHYGMYKLSKNAINNIDGYLSEEEKIDLINNVYTTKKIKESDVANDYIEEVKNTISYLESGADDAIDRRSVMKKFRDIDSIQCMPYSVYESNRMSIKDKISFLNDYYKGKNKSKDYLDKKIEYSNYLDQLTVAVPTYIVYEVENIYKVIEVGKRNIIILSKGFNYSFDKGLSLSKNIDDEDSNVW